MFLKKIWKKVRSYVPIEVRQKESVAVSQNLKYIHVEAMVTNINYLTIATIDLL